MKGKMKSGSIVILFLAIASLCNAQPPEKLLNEYRNNLNALRKLHPNVRDMPDIKFFLFGMGDRKKLIYKNGSLIDAKTKQVLYQWKVSEEIIVPSAYSVYLKTAGGNVQITEDQKGVYLTENGKRKILASSKLNLPAFKGHPFASVLRVLLHEILINIDNGLPLPNFMVYKKPWYRDATLMAMVLKETRNLRLIKDWILNIRDPFDRNNHGISEADNPGQVLFLISLVSDAKHPAVSIILDSITQFKKQNFIEGKTDYALHPVFQTKWIKYGLKSLALPDAYKIPLVYDSYSSLFWWGFKNYHINGSRFDNNSGKFYPYLVWAEDHFLSEHNGIMTNRDYPLTWESHASDADYTQMDILDSNLVKEKICLTHTWHAAEMFLYLQEKKSFK